MNDRAANLRAVDEHLARSREIGREMEKSGKRVVTHLRRAAAALREREHATRPARS